MFSSIWSDVKREYQYGNMINRIIIVNISIFLIVNILRIVLYIFHKGFLPPVYNDILHFFCMGADWRHILYHPWVILTNMFLHESFFHILWNMLYLFWFGQIVGDLIGNYRVLPIYILGGIAGAFVYFISANYFGDKIGSYALGASAAVMAIAMCAAVMAPDYILRFVIIGEVKLKYVVGVLFLLDLIGTTTSINSGGHLAHIGGALMGYIYAKRLRSGNDLAIPINKTIDFLSNTWENIFSRKPKPKMAYKNPETPKTKKEPKPFDPKDNENQALLDKILDKIKASGYDSLNQDEKEFLFKMSK